MSEQGVLESSSGDLTSSSVTSGTFGTSFPSVLSRSYVFNKIQKFVMKERLVSATGDDFSICAEDGRTLFEVIGKLLSPRGRKTLRKMDGTPLLELKAKVLSLRAEMTLHDMTGTILLTTRKTGVLQVKSKNIDIFLGSSTASSIPQFRVIGNTMATRFVLKDATDDEIARVVRHSTNNKRLSTGQDTFQVHVNPGYDCLVVLMIVVCLDEAWSD